ncbi:acyloxyacyl hydrolase [Flavobacterium sp.]|uniref:acyloxyacyl hydrolase n=1 Tax=Flavobacterium sp. TaxID=239 RepID=UPI0038FCB9D4
MKIKDIFIYLFFCSTISFAQDKRFQLPIALQKSYFEVNVGSINYNFTQSQLESLPDYEFQSVEVPHTAVRLVLFGHKFNNYLSAQISYMRPVSWVNYKYLTSGTTQSTSVWMNIAGLTIKGQIPIAKKIHVFGELGLGIITRLGGANLRNGDVLVKKANYSSFLFGGGFKYNLNPKIDLLLSSVFSPEKAAFRQPAISFVSTGFSYNLNPIREEKIQEAKKVGYKHPKQLFQIGYSSTIIGYGINNLFSKIPIFWGGEAEVNRGISFDYRQNVFNTAKYFSLDWGVGASFFMSNIKEESFYTIAAYPVFRFNFLHTKPFDTYVYYSIAGPSFISKKVIDDVDTGEKFTFQDNMGLGFYFGEDRKSNVEFKIGHYSNGNIFTQNPGVKIPFSVNLGYAF